MTSASAAKPPRRDQARLVYVLYLLQPVTGFTALVGIVIAHLARASHPLERAHRRRQLELFWVGFPLSLLSLALLVCGAWRTLIVLFDVRIESSDLLFSLSMVALGATSSVALLCWWLVQCLRGWRALESGLPPAARPWPLTSSNPTAAR
ncbi:hypothetical protein [Halotalea alkalilenta]|uniref:hypothetical protein n=1 Tax=Halotalea alkalilenta TaxID=376489 RepID=UPI000487543A|nr:hypothetical protein [Halotalea alkalilenta]